ncbi:hypothetical protein PsorP6_002668 [Peronosclerospora sorghi]|uniref:Uncharacterized protein n=1 Tax=Peronosclerospora sorghi TaxID=230839 RepID=A0ACC0WWI8_9STRA|nr:hypothetical protein PsorP6_002668 [Peronosclerospora sorghi]
MSLPCANATLMKSSLDRLLVQFDTLLMIDPINVDSYNQKVSQYMGQLVSRVHLVARNMTYWNKTDIRIRLCRCFIELHLASRTRRCCSWAWI